jgi:hypothetical protein
MHPIAVDDPKVNWEKKQEKSFTGIIDCSRLVRNAFSCLPE